MKRSSSHHGESKRYSSHHENVNVRQNECHDLVSYPARYYSRPPQPSDTGSSSIRSDVPQWSVKIKTEPDFHTDDSENFVQQSTSGNAVKLTASHEHADYSTLSNIAATSGGTTDEVEKLKWKPGQGPVIDLRLLVPGKVKWLSVSLLTGHPVVNLIHWFLQGSLHFHYEAGDPA